ncbi:hypothetical protein CJU89_3778 [Yarrowia sp. B02]|nr:hypothetical protein CJU89_3778 [Yarrowia sp. B02]
MIRRLNTLNSAVKSPDPAVIFKAAAQKTPSKQNRAHQKHSSQNKHKHSSTQTQTQHHKYQSASNSRFRLFVQPFEVSTLLRDRGALLQSLKAQHDLYALNLSPFVHASASRRLRIKVDSEQNIDEATAEKTAKDAKKLAEAITDMYRLLIQQRPRRDANGLALKPGSAQLRFAVTNSVAAKFDKMCAAMFGGAAKSSESISVNKQLVPDSRDQLLLVNVKREDDLERVAAFIRELVLQEAQTPLNEASDLPRAHILPRSDINYHAHTAQARRGGFQKIRLIIPDHMVGTVIGRGGENIKQLRETSGAFISLKSEANKSSQVQIVAPEGEQVQRALAALKGLLENEWYSDKSAEEIERIFLRAGYNV